MLEFGQLCTFDSQVRFIPDVYLVLSCRRHYDL
jgi:hypothetical protein